MQSLTTPVTADLIRGALDIETTERGVLPHRLPPKARAQVNDEQLRMAEAQPSGCRIAFRTSASWIELDSVPTKRVYVGAPPRPDGVYELAVDGDVIGRGSVTGGNTITIDMTAGTFSHDVGDPGTVRFDGLPDGDKDVEIWLPHNETAELVALRSDAPLEVAAPSDRPVWLHHGSSISHGTDSPNPTGTWPAIAARRAGVELVNLGFGGGAVLDPFTARAMRDTPADLVTVKIGINVINLDAMRLRAFAPAVHGFLDTIREGHPTTPLVVISSVLCPIHEETPGPSGPDMEALGRGEMRFVATGNPAEVPAGKLTLRVIRDELARIVADRSAHDPHLHHVDGTELYGVVDAADLPLPDGLHPDAATHELIGERFVELVLGPRLG
ncbi:GDSL-type esterase/lipase family protein [Nocardioides sp. Soil796]|uniref:GDSL-type esterase/lipase family protein n=1 Tax=Nocardioides sp. Soil796 TaxID=1736412 RepID=UPI00070A24FE|nr:GDSL-type esterase/lipase family protein [Nocardioides sp. Soil796]KRF18323.1 lipase [Nocardioides sp. Soil796]